MFTAPTVGTRGTRKLPDSRSPRPPENRCLRRCHDIATSQAGRRTGPRPVREEPEHATSAPEVKSKERHGQHDRAEANVESKPKGRPSPLGFGLVFKPPNARKITVR